MSSPTPREDVATLAVVAVGGALGSLGRWGVAEALPHEPGAFAVATLLVNLTGCLAIGVLVALVLGSWGRFQLLRPALGVGLLGGWTTFSTLATDLRVQLAAGHEVVALAYLVASVLGGVALTWVGLLLGRATPAGRPTTSVPPHARDELDEPEEAGGRSG